MKTHYSPASGKWLDRTTDFLPAHDLYYGSPIADRSAGIPFGDGDTGSLLWLSEDAIHIIVNKTDLWDDSTHPDDGTCSQEDENLTCLRHGGELVIGFSSPCFDMLYQKSFEGRLKLAEAAVTVDSATAFSSVGLRAFASAEAKVSALRCRYSAEDGDAPQVSLRRWGSRNLWRWYARMADRPEAGLSGTEAEAEQNALYITQELNGTCFCVGALLACELGAASSRPNRHEARLSLSRADSGELTLYYNISTGKTAADARAACAEALASAAELGFERLLSGHVRAWADFWNVSRVSVPDDYIENCLYLSLYYSNCECRGPYPPLFTSGLWAFNHDFYPWAYYFHYNMQHMFCPVEATGHGDLASGYYAFRRRGLDAACAYDARFKHTGGAFYHDVADRYGRGADYDSDNCTPGPQIAMAMWRHYRMSGDEAFLRGVALPVMRGAARFYLGFLKKGDDGVYHVRGATAYEGTPLFDDTITDLSMIRALFGTLAELVDADERRRLEDVLAALPGYTLVDAEPDEIVGGALAYGIGKGKEASGDKVLAVAYKDGRPIRKSYGDLGSPKNFYGFPDTELSPIYPASVFGIANRGSEVFDAMRNQILLHPAAERCMEWCMMPLYLARMGMADELPACLRDMASAWLHYPCGLGVEGPSGEHECGDHTRFNNVNVLGTDKKVRVDSFPFRHFDMEALPIIAGGTVEALLQSHGGLIRVCPAVRPADAVSFRLFAEGGFAIGAEVSERDFLVTVESLRGEPCLLRLPEYADLNSLHAYVKRLGGEFVPFKPKYTAVGSEKFMSLGPVLARGGTALLLSRDIAELEPTPSAKVEPNRSVKLCGRSALGTDGVGAEPPKN